MDLQKHFETFRDALLNAFPSYELYEFALFQFKKDINQDFEGSKKQRALELIRWAQGEGLVDKLIAEALAKKPNNSELRTLAGKIQQEYRTEFDQLTETLASYRSNEEHNPKAAAVKALVDQQPVRQLISHNQVTGHLQAFAVNAPHLQSGQAISEWIATLQRRLNAVCTIGKNGKHYGTGFLIGDDVVMTNCHVTDLVGIATAEIHFGFVDGVARNGLPKYSVATELARSEPKEFDYSILKLATAPANLTPITATPRVLTLREPVYVIGHPGDSPLRLSSGTIWDENSFVGRVAYSANTQRGSSGSPVFDETWQLIALHHQGEDNMNNHGIPTRAIREDLKKNDLQHLF